MKTKTIVLLDRDPEVGATIRTMLESDGHTVIVTSSPSGMLTALSKHPADVVVTNCVTGAFEEAAPLLDTVRAMRPQAAIVLTTRWNGELDNPVPFDAILPKPFSILDLREVVATVTRRR